MAGEVGHIVYAARLLTYLGSAVQDPEYWVGTLFPDIKHLGVISRRRTHVAGVSLRTLTGTTDFATGLRVHAWIDETREHFLRRAHIKETLPWHPFVPHALKLYEDELLYQHFDDWNLIHRLLNTVHDSELHYVQSEQFIRRWHTILQDYLAAPPSDDTRARLATDIGLSRTSAEELNKVVAVLRSDRRAEKTLHHFWEYLERLLR